MAPFEDAGFIAKDYGVCVGSTLDLRYLAVMARCEPHGLSKLALDHLNVKLDKNWRIRCSNWEANELSQQQLDYAAKDAHVAVEIFRVLAKKIEPNAGKSFVNAVLERCYDFIDLRFKNIRMDSTQTIVGQSRMANKKM